MNSFIAVSGPRRPRRRSSRRRSGPRREVARLEHLAETTHESGHETSGGLEVVELRDLVGRVHVAHRQAEVEGGRAAAGGLQTLVVGLRVAGIGLDLHRDALGDRHLLEQGEQARVAAAAPPERRTAAENQGPAGAPRVDFGLVGGEVGVDHDHAVGLLAARLDLRSHEAGLLLHCRERGEGGGPGSAGVELERPHRDVHADAIVERPAGDDAAGELDEVRAEDDGVATGDARKRRGTVGGADVDPLLAELRGLAALGFGDHVRRPLADDSVDRPLATLDDDGAAGQQQRIDAAELVEVDEPLLVDPGHLQTDLVGVSGHDDVRRGARIDRGGDVAEHVGLGGGDRRQAPAHDLLHGLFEAARPRNQHQIAHERDVGRSHTYLL